MLKSNIDYFCGVISLLAQVFIVSSNRVSYEKKMAMAQFLWYDCTFKKQCTIPVTLTFEGQFLVNWVQPYKYRV